MLSVKHVGAQVDSMISYDSPFTNDYDIAYSIMDTKKLAKLRGELAALRRKMTNAREYEALAGALGRKINDRGKHPMWMSEHFDLPPLSIPRHGGKDIAKPTAKSILDQMEEDIIAWDEYFEEREDGEDE